MEETGRASEFLRDWWPGRGSVLWPLGSGSQGKPASRV